MAEDYEDKQTVFNSSLLTLNRINSLIELAHRCRLNALDPKDKRDPKWLYIETIDRRYIEAKKKMNKAEVLGCEEYQKKINGIKYQYGANLYRPYISNCNKINPKYIEGWNRLNITAREYEMVIMGILDAHNMLLSDQKDMISRFKGE